jgi:hypothetical protein
LPFLFFKEKKEQNEVCLKTGESLFCKTGLENKFLSLNTKSFNDLIKHYIYFKRKKERKKK